MCVFSQLITTPVRLEHLVYQVLDSLNVSIIFPETSSLFIGNIYPFLFLFLLFVLRYFPFHVVVFISSQPFCLLSLSNTKWTTISRNYFCLQTVELVEQLNCSKHRLLFVWRAPTRNLTGNIVSVTNQPLLPQT